MPLCLFMSGLQLQKVGLWFVFRVGGAIYNEKGVIAWGSV